MRQLLGLRPFNTTLAPPFVRKRERANGSKPKCSTPVWALSCPETECAAERSAREEAAAMSSSGAVTLGEIAGRLAMLEVACSRCERRGLPCPS